MARSRSKNRRRRNSFPNTNVLPTSISRRDTLSTLAQLSNLLSPKQSFDFWDDDMPVVRKARPAFRGQLAYTYKKPKLYGVREPVINKSKAVTTAPDVTPVCVSRTVRGEVMHAIGKAGKAGQKSPRWTKKSKVRC